MLLNQIISTTSLCKNKSTTSSIISESSTAYNWQHNNDKRVYLSVIPDAYKTGEIGNFAERISYVLGRNINSSNQLYGYLRQCLSGTAGLVFPYTPKISVNHGVNYDSTDIYHSNLQMKHYRNTPSPSFNLSATFTANNLEMAKYMLAAIWFLRACTKCDFGEQSEYAGLPPPILYLNGWNNTFDSIPVVITSFGYEYPDNIDYVAVELNFENSNFSWSSDISTNLNSGSSITANDYLNGTPLSSNLFSTCGCKTSMTNNYSNSNQMYLKEWLPLELQITLRLEVQYNSLKYQKVFDLDEYKMGILNLHKDGSTLKVINSSNGVLQDVSSTSNYGTKTENGSGTSYQFDKSGWTW